jgi:predicted phage-related endonuclease
MSVLSEEQQAIRRNCITASGVAAILGLHPYRRPIDEWAWLVHGVVQSDTAETRWGHAVEDAVRSWLTLETGIPYVVPGTLVAEDDPRHAATPDGIGYRDGRPLLGLEIKAHSSWLRDDYGAPGSDEVPDHELLQCAWGMRVTRLERWQLAVTFGHAPVVFQLERDHELEQLVVTEVNAWWSAYVEPRIPPPPDGSDAYDRWVRRHQAVDAELAYEGDVPALVEQLRASFAVQIEAEREYGRARQELQERLGAATKIVTPAGTITWRADKNGQRTFRVPKQWR